ncbi:hypothetical protein ACA910_019802 [Epithemia clementina (nom. ined.)]
MVLETTFYASAVASLMMNGLCCAWQMQEEEERRDVLRRDLRVEHERQRLQTKEMWEQMHQSFYDSENSHYRHPNGDANNGRRRRDDGSSSASPASPTTRNLSFSADVERRRRKLVAEKAQLWAAANASTAANDHNEQTEHEHQTPTSTSAPLNSSAPCSNQQQQHLRMPFPPKPVPHARTRTNDNKKKCVSSESSRRVRSMPVAAASSRIASTNTTPIIGEPSMEVMTETSASRSHHRKLLSLNENMILCLMDEAHDDKGDTEEEDGSLEDIPLK